MYTKQELERLFKVMEPDEHLVFSVLLEAGLRKKEMMHLEDGDFICDEFIPGDLEVRAYGSSPSRSGAI